MKRDANAIHVDRFPVIDGADGRTGSEPRAKDLDAFARAQISRGAPACVVAMTVRDDRALDRLPWIDIEVAGLTIQAALGKTKERHAAKIVGMTLLVLGVPGSRSPVSSVLARKLR